jgi:hypothetical protein
MVFMSEKIYSFFFQQKFENVWTFLLEVLI